MSINVSRLPWAVKGSAAHRGVNHSPPRFSMRVSSFRPRAQPITTASERCPRATAAQRAPPPGGNSGSLDRSTPACVCFRLALEQGLTARLSNPHSSGVGSTCADASTARGRRVTSAPLEAHARASTARFRRRAPLRRSELTRSPARAKRDPAPRLCHDSRGSLARLNIDSQVDLRNAPLGGRGHWTQVSEGSTSWTT